ncbi:uncharacterized protein LOC103507135 [Diaphorina citri]|uniref:Uncharacterized protein LOC103507135 n=1 Tax=Diaphorina citri TaxID=121845 RepID=A0A3Q0INR9_DIACI|nr:uncharacterized protein LOC103507135 [Diaphorina citri]
MTFVASMRQLEERHVANKTGRGELPAMSMAHISEEKRLVMTFVDKERRSFDLVEVNEEGEEVNLLTCYNIASVYLPKLPTLCRHFRSEAEPNEENLEDIKKIKSQTVLNFLILCLEDGKISISVFGLYNVAQIETNIHLPRGHLCEKILGCELSKDLRHLFVTVLLHFVILKMTESIADSSSNEWSTQELQFIADYLCTFDELGSCDSEQPPTPNSTQKIFMDTLGQYFVDKELVKPYKHATNPWEQLLESNPCLQKHNIIIPRHSNLSLIQEINNLKYFFTICHLNLSSPSDQLNILDVQFYTSTVLGVLLEDDPAHNSVAHFIFVPLNTLKNASFTDKSGASFTEKPGASFDKSVAGFTDKTPGLASQNLASPQAESRVDLAAVFDTKDFYVLDSMVAGKFAASGVRNVLVVLAETRRKIRLFEIDTEGEEEGEVEEEEMSGEGSMNISQ